MSDDKNSSVSVSAELRKKFPELISLILSSESMNDEERQYWINILPVMTPEQHKNLREILKNEKDQLSAIDTKYAKEMEQMGQKTSVEEIAKDRRSRRTEQRIVEGKSEEEELKKEDEILKAIAEMDGQIIR